MSATAQKIDPRVKRTRRLLLDAFVSLLAEKSCEAIPLIAASITAFEAAGR